MARKGWVGAAALLLLPALAAPEGDWRAGVQEDYRKGLERLQKAQEASKEDRYEAYSKALASFEAARATLEANLPADAAARKRWEQTLAEIQSCIYWAKKFRPLKDRTAEERPPPPGPSEAKGREEEAGARLAAAEAFASEHSDDAFRAAIRYFEVADRYRGTDASFQAMQKCLEAAQRFLDERQFAGAAARLDLPAEEAPAAPKVDEKGLESAMKHLRLECMERARLQRRRDEISASLSKGGDRLAEVKGLLAAGKGSLEALSNWTKERDRLVADDIPKWKGDLEKQDRKIAKQEAEIDASVAAVERFGPGALPAVERYLADPKANRDMLPSLERLKGKWAPGGEPKGAKQEEEGR